MRTFYLGFGCSYNCASAGRRLVDGRRRAAMAIWSERQSLNSTDDGLAGRSVVSLDFAPDLGIFRPSLSANFGGI